MRSTNKEAGKILGGTSPANISKTSNLFDNDKDINNLNLFESQKDQIFKYLFSGKKLTALEALNLFGCWSLAQRIFNLKSEGVDIITERIKTSTGKFIAQYSIQKFITNGKA